MFSSVVKHFKEGHANGHEKAGMFGAILFSLGLSYFGFAGFLIGLVLGGAIIGVLIEIAQYVYRAFYHLPQNSRKEVVLDIAVTALWPMFLKG